MTSTKGGEYENHSQEICCRTVRLAVFKRREKVVQLGDGRHVCDHRDDERVVRVELVREGMITYFQDDTVDAENGAEAANQKEAEILRGNKDYCKQSTHSKRNYPAEADRDQF